jgi:hypothetical protein
MRQANTAWDPRDSDGLAARRAIDSASAQPASHAGRPRIHAIQWVK